MSFLLTLQIRRVWPRSDVLNRFVHRLVTYSRSFERSALETLKISAVLESITDELSFIVAKTLNAYHSECSEPIKALALDVHPWNGFIALAVLTESEVAADPLLDDIAQMAAWKHYDFGVNLEDWDVNSVGTKMKAIYYEKEDAQLLFQCCASAMAAASIQQAISKYKLADGFRISVAEPDSNTEYYNDESA